MNLELERQFQILSGKAAIGRNTVPVGAGRIIGHKVQFRVPDPTIGRGIEFRGELMGPHLRGTWELEGEAAGSWGGTREMPADKI